MALTLRKPRTLKIFLQICIIMSIFCSTGYAAAHGKRSDVRDIPLRILASKTLLNGSPENGITPSKTQWVLSRFITGQSMLPLTDKYRVRWDDLLKDKSYVQPKWDHDTLPMVDESIETIRIPINNENKNDGRKISSTQDTIRNMNKKFKDNPEIFLISPDEYDKPINSPQKSDIFKFLNEGNGETK
ncbi:uncharacterized protein LOC105837425 isoform X2 [Monomorium pharaonis]|uniref:uncharacterized protein LOC105837425 isoform X2 n=1 Tax=Monomorium pharaonis TaxID=307658 RepID=UPI0017463FBF|nr:uncharacterized protein LOC105837425 isoform X2 [Monomorium pharaonis]